MISLYQKENTFWKISVSRHNHLTSRKRVYLMRSAVVLLGIGCLLPRGEKSDWVRIPPSRMENVFSHLIANQRMGPSEWGSPCTLDHGLANCGPWAKSGPWPFFVSKDVWNTAMPSHLSIVCNCFCGKVE